MPYAESKHPTMHDTAPTDTRRWRIVSDYLGNDSQPYTTAELFDYAAECNQEHAADPEWGTPFKLVDAGDKIIDVSHGRGNDGYLAAVLRNTNRRRDKDMVTPDRIMTWNPCEDYPRQRVEEIIGNCKTPLECLDLDIPPEDRLWLVLRPDVIPARELRKLACDFATEVLPIFEASYPDDRRPRASIEAAQGFARGDATALEWAASDAANAAASAAAWAASDASDAARAAARQRQIDITRRVLGAV